MWRVERVRKARSGRRERMTDLPFLPLAVLDFIAHIAVSDVNHFYLSGKSKVIVVVVMLIYPDWTQLPLAVRSCHSCSVSKL